MAQTAHASALASHPRARWPSRQRRTAWLAAGATAQGTRESPRVTFTNPDGDVLRRLRDGLWVADRPFVWNSIDVGGRMAVIRLADGSLWVHSPVELDATLADALRALGPVRHVVSPNFEHVKYAKQWLQAYPEAIGYGCPGLSAAHPAIPFAHTIANSCDAPESWPSEITAAHLPFERNPLSGKPFFNEVVFSHAPTGAFVTADFFWNWPSDAPLGTLGFKFAMDQLFKPFYFGVMVTDRRELQAKVEQVLSQDWDLLIPCHGNIVDKDAKAVLRRFAGL